MIVIFKNLILTNWQVKLFCFFSASLLWFYVTSSQQTIAKFPGNVTIKTINSSSDLIPIYDQKTVEIKIMAKQNDWQRLSAESFSANIDLAGLTVGTHEVDVHVVSAISGITVVDITPSNILVTLDPLVSKEVSVSKKVEGNAADGMVVGSVSFRPEKVQIKGAKSLIENIEEVFGTIVLNGQSINFQERTSLLIYDADGKIVDSIEITPNEVEAGVSIVRGSNVKTLGVKPRISGSPKTGYYIASVDVNPSVVEVTGPRNTINDTKYLETTPIDITDLFSNLDRDVALEIPVDLTVISNGLTKVRVTVTILNIETTGEISVTSFSPSNLTAEIDSYSPSAIKLSVKGPTVLIGALNQNIALNYNFANLSKIDDHTYILQISPDQFSLPANVSVLSIDPMTILIKTK